MEDQNNWLIRLLMLVSLKTSHNILSARIVPIDGLYKTFGSRHSFNIFSIFWFLHPLKHEQLGIIFDW